MTTEHLTEQSKPDVGFDALKKIYEVMAETDPTRMDPKERTKKLSDGTVIDLSTGGELISVRVSNASIEDRSFYFRLTREGLADMWFFPRFDITIGNITIPRIRERIDVEVGPLYLLPEGSENIHRRASKHLADWVTNMINDDHYTSPPISISQPK